MKDEFRGNNERICRIKTLNVLLYNDIRLLIKKDKKGKGTKNL